MTDETLKDDFEQNEKGELILPDDFDIRDVQVDKLVDLYTELDGASQKEFLRQFVSFPIDDDVSGLPEIEGPKRLQKDPVYYAGHTSDEWAEKEMLAYGPGVRGDLSSPDSHYNCRSDFGIKNEVNDMEDTSGNSSEPGEDWLCDECGQAVQKDSYVNGADGERFCDIDCYYEYYNE